MDKLNFKEFYREFDLSVRYFEDDDNIINFEVENRDEEILMVGKFLTDNYYRAVFQVYVTNIEENLYENMFYLYFENIKVKCIEIVENREEWEAYNESLGLTENIL